MKIFRPTILAVNFIGFFVFATQAQLPAKKLVELRVALGDVSEHRTTSKISSCCTIELKLLGDAATEAVDVIKVRVHKAEDDLKRNLVWTATENPLAYLDTNQKGDPGPLKTYVTLHAPSRRATSINLLEGEVEVFAPTPANGGLILLKDYFKNPLTPISHPLLKRHQLEVLYVTKEAFQSQKDNFPRYRALLGSGWPSSNTPARLYLINPKQLLVRVDFLNADGVSQESTPYPYRQEVRPIDLKVKPSAGAQVVLKVMTPEAKRSLPFKIENIPLP